MEDKQFTTQFLAVLVILVGFTIVILVIANFLYSSDSATMDDKEQQRVAERIKPVGEVYIGSVPVSETAASASKVEPSSAAGATVAAADLSAEAAYQQVCAVCHDAGVLNAPKPGDAAAWEPRRAKGLDTLYANAINGIGAMPAKGGRADLSDDVIKAAVDYLLQ